MKEKNIAIKVSIVTIIINSILTILKLCSGMFGYSKAMLSDAIHSASDVFSTIVVIIGIRLSSKKADKEHPYGHERLECVASLILAIGLIFVGIGIGLSGIKSIFSNNYIHKPGLTALIAAVLSILIKEGMYWYTIKAAKKINSTALKADAWHHRSDALSSIGSLIGIIGARLGYLKLDAIASIIICLFIFKVAVDIFKDAIDKMIDKSCDKETIKQVRCIVMAHKGVENIDDIKTRLFGNKIYIDLEISVDQNKSLLEAHSIADEIHNILEEKMPNLKHCMIHVNPSSH